MFLIENDSNFKPLHRAHTVSRPGDFLFIYEESKIGLTLENKIPILVQPSSTQPIYCFGEISQHQCLLVPKSHFSDFSALTFTEARYSHQWLDKEFYQAAALGSHLTYWRAAHRYCGKCAALMLDKLDEQALICSQCAYIAYPKISPCAMVLITRGKEILLARSPHFAPGIMSVLAGFVAVGESVEQTVVREVKEEVGVEIGGLKYVCSQPWPFPDSLMLGFTAEHRSGDIQIDHHEIEEAGWFNKNNLPPLPNKMSMGRYLIERYIEQLR